VTTPRLLISDIDGTIVRHDKSLSDPVVAAVRQLDAAGVAMSLISARPPSGILPIARRLGLSTPMGAFNGGTIFDRDGRILAAERLDGDVARRALALVDTPGIYVWLFSEGRWHASRLGSAHDDSERATTGQEPAVQRDLTPLLATVDKIVAVSEDHDALAALEGTAAQALGDGATVARSQPYYLDITAARANKGDGVAALSAFLSIPLNEVAVLGDQHNDMAMFARAGLSIAMGQAPADVQAAADHVTRSNDEDGVAAAIAELILPLAAPR